MQADPTTPVRVLASYSLMTGLTPLIPIPFVDDLVQDRLMRQLVQQIAQHRSVVLPQADIVTLASEPETGGTLRRLAGSVVLYPVKKVLRKTFLVLEGKRAVDLAAHTYAVGWLIDTSMRWRAYPVHPALTAAVVRKAAEESCKKLNTSPLEHAFRKVYDESRTGISRAVESLWSSASKSSAASVPPPANDGSGASSAPSSGPVASAAETEARVEQATATATQALPVSSMAERFERILRDTPSDYFQRLEIDFYARLRGVAG